MPKRRKQRSTSKAPTSLLAKILLVAFGILVAVVVGEVAIRVLDLGPNLNVVYSRNYRLSDNPVLQYELVPGSRDGAFRISAAGLRDREYLTTKPAGRFRILVIGDSIAYGFGVAQNQTFSRQLEDLLVTYWPDAEVRFEVLNLGVTGYSIEQVVESLRVRGLQFDPDLIIYCYCLNDPMAYSFELESLKAQLSNAKAAYREDLLRRGEMLAGKLRIYLLTKYAWRAWRGREAGASDVEDQQWTAIADGSYDRFFTAMYDDAAGEERVRSGIARLQQISRETGAPVVTLIFPVFYDLGAYRLAHLHTRVASWHEAEDARVYDLLDLYVNMFRSHGNVFVHNALHPNATGHRLAALYALERLADDGLLPLSTGPTGELTQRDRLLANVVAQTRAQ